MPDSQLDRDLSALGVLVRKSADAVEVALAGLTTTQRNTLRGPLSAAVLTVLAGAYTKDRQRYRSLDPASPPTPVPKPSL